MYLYKMTPENKVCKHALNQIKSKKVIKFAISVGMPTEKKELKKELTNLDYFVNLFLDNLAKRRECVK